MKGKQRKWRQKFKFHLLNVHSLRGIDAEHASDELLGAGTDVLPFWVREVVLARPDARLHARRNGQTVVAVEWRETAQSKEKFVAKISLTDDSCHRCTYKMYMITPRDQMSQLLSYFSGPSTSGAT